MDFKTYVMIFLVFISVSTLATHGNTLAADQKVIRHECEGRTLCGVKPAGYPQEDIDRLVLKHLPLLQRMKRQTLLPTSFEPDSTTPGGNCAVIRKTTTAYTIQNKKSGLPEVIIQSKWFNQTITEVICAKDPTMESGCFSSLTNGMVQIKTRCQTKYLDILLTVYNAKENKPIFSDVRIGVDCACVIFE